MQLFFEAGEVRLFDRTEIALLQMFQELQMPLRQLFHLSGIAPFRQATDAVRRETAVAA